MTSLTLSVSEELKEKMAEFPEINWSAVARQAIIEKLRLLEKMNNLLSKSELTEDDTLLLGKKVNKSVAKRYSDVK